MRVCVTGAHGFVGQALCAGLDARKHEVMRVVRRAKAPLDVAVGSIGPSNAWGSILDSVDAVVHLAGRVHVMHDPSSDPLALFRQVNVQGTLNLARQAASAGVGLFVFASSIKVNGEGFAARDSISSGLNPVYTESSLPAPQDAYAISKWEAEQGLLKIARETGMGVVILRMPLVYGPRVGANFLRLLRLVDLGVPLPFGAFKNSRSLLYLGNLVDAIASCINHPSAQNRVYLVSDGEDISTPELIGKLALLMNRPARLLSVPCWVMELAGKMTGKGDEIRRLSDSLVLDSRLLRQELGWKPPFTMQEGLAETIAWFRQLEQIKG